MFKTQTLTTPRLTLRRFEPSDFNDFYEYYTDEKSRDFIAGYPPVEREAVRKIFDDLLKSELTWAVELSWLAELSVEKKVIGEIYLTNIVSFYLVSVGYLFNSQYWGNGYAAEALDAVTSFAFGQIGLGRIRAVTLTKNARSIRLLELCGFKREALIYEADYGGRVENVFYYSKESEQKC